MKYAIAPREQGGAVTVIAGIEGRSLRLAVVDDGPGLPPAVANANGRGVGLRNTRERLKVLYGDAHSVEVADASPGLSRRDAVAAGGLKAMAGSDSRHHRRRRAARAARTRAAPARLQRLRDRRPVRERARGDRLGRAPRAGPHVPRHRDAGHRRLRGAAPHPADQHADGRLRDRFRPLCDRRLRLRTRSTTC